MKPDINQIRRYNISLLIKEEPRFEKKLTLFCEATGIKYSSMQAMVAGRTQTISDEIAGKIESKLKLEAGYLDENRGAIPPIRRGHKIPKGKRLVTTTQDKPKRKVKVVPTGELHFKAEGFELRAELKSGSEFEKELVRLALRIVEIRSR